MRSIVEKALQRIGGGSSIPFAVRFTDGTEYRSGDAVPAFTLVFREKLEILLRLRDFLTMRITQNEILVW